MKRLDPKLRSQVLHLLCEGMSIRAVTRLTGVSKTTVTKLLVDAGTPLPGIRIAFSRTLNAAAFRLTRFGALSARRRRTRSPKRRRPDEAGDVWLWVATDADTKLVPSFLVGGRDSQWAMAFIDDLASRLANRVQLTSDGHSAYLDAVEAAFGGDIDYAMIVKLYGEAPESMKAATAPQNASERARSGSKATPIARTSARPTPSGTTSISGCIRAG